MTKCASHPISNLTANFYPPKRKALGKHSDDEASIVPKSNILTVTLKSSALMTIRTKDAKAEVKGVVMLEPGSLLIMTADSQKILTHEMENDDHPEARISITGRAVRSNFVGQDRKQLDLWGELLGMKDKLKNFVDASTQLAEEVKVLQQLQRIP